MDADIPAYGARFFPKERVVLLTWREGVWILQKYAERENGLEGEKDIFA